MFERNHEINALCNKWTTPVEWFAVEKQKGRLVTAATGDIVDQTKTAMEIAAGWLPAAAEKYRISPNLRDYILVPTIILSSVLPNRNGIGFPYETLTEWNPEIHQLAYKGWTGCPTHAMHDNKDYTKAKGVVFDTLMRLMPHVEGGLSHVVCLCGFDRTKDPTLTNKLMTSDTIGLSLGCWAANYTCSICGHFYKPHEECAHVRLNAMPKYQLFDDRGRQVQANGRLAYYDAREISPIEVSAVTVPAFPSAQVSRDSLLRIS